MRRQSINKTRIYRNPVKPKQPEKPKMTVEIPRYTHDETKKIAIIQGGAWGDNINSTLMLIPLKNHFKDSIIDIHTSNIYGNAFDNNPYVDNVLKHKCHDKNDAINLAKSLPSKLQESNYDIISTPHPVFNHDKWSSAQHPEWGENLIFAWVRAIEDLSVPYDKLETVLKLTDAEIKRANDKLNNIPKDKKKVLMEIHGESGQTPWNPHWTKTVGSYLCDRGCVLLISHKGMREDIKYLSDRYRSQIFYVGDLSIRECAEVFNNSDAFISVSSGLSNACNTNWCKKSVKWFEVVNSITCSSAAIRSDNKTFWHKGLDGFIELLKGTEL